ncbi:MAG: Heat shock protein, family [Myxococcaceae bacterium]|nr:Heat shock protein, family [Myxococcaceae bacterium]
MAIGIQRRKLDPGTLAQPERRWDPFEELEGLTRWDPYREFTFPLTGRPEGFVPDFDVKETHQAYVFRADLPGVKEGDLDISLEGNRLTISGDREEEEREDTDRYFTCERSCGAFTRTFTLPNDVEAERAEALLKNGVLTLKVPKAPERQARRIQVKARSGPQKDQTRS